MRIPGWLKAIGAALAALGLIWAGAKVLREVGAVVGPVFGDTDPWIPDPKDPRRILVELRGETVSVPLPAGIRAERVRAVAAAEGGKVKVEALP